MPLRTFFFTYKKYLQTKTKCLFRYKQQMMKELNKNGLDFAEEDLLDDSEKDDSSDDNFDYF